MEKQLKCLHPSVSDHALLSIEDKVCRAIRGMRFKFYNCITTMNEYEDIVSNSWNIPIQGTAMYVLWNKLQRFKPTLTQFSKQICYLKIHVEKARTNLSNAYQELNLNRMDGNYIEKVKQCTEELINWNTLEEKVLMQREKVDWISLGDSNNAYFYVSIKSRSKHKRMDLLQRADDVIITEQHDIKKRGDAVL